MRLTLDETVGLVKITVIVGAGIYVWHRGIGGILSDVLGAASKQAEVVVGAATNSTTLDTNGSIKELKDAGYEDDQSKLLELLALGNLGA